MPENKIPDETLTRIYCPTCQGIAEEIIFAEKNTRTGWWCKKCNTIIKAIGRERIWK